MKTVTVDHHVEEVKIRAWIEVSIEDEVSN